MLLFDLAFSKSGLAAPRAGRIEAVHGEERAAGQLVAGAISDPGKYAVKTLVTAGAKKGFARADVVVPAANELAVWPVFVDDNKNGVLVKDTKETYPFDLSAALVLELDQPSALTVQRRANPAERLTVRISPNP